MNWLNNRRKDLNFLSFFIGVFIVALQVQWTLSIANWGIRLSLSDLLLPFLILYFGIGKRSISLFELFKEKPWVFVWIIAFSGWLGFSLLQGYFETGKLSNWALFNKFLGWFILIGYFLLGGGVTRLNNQEFLKERILRILFISTACISLISLIAAICFHYGLYLPFGVYKGYGIRLAGFLENPNAYGLFCIFVILLQLPFITSKKMFPAFIHTAIATLNVVSAIGSGSRGAWLTLLIGMSVCLLFKVVSLKKLFLIGVYSCLLFSCLGLQGVDLDVAHRKENLLSDAEVMQSLVKEIVCDEVEPAKKVEDATLQRIVGTKKAFKWWQERPLIGIGLGQFLVKQGSGSNSNPPMTMHNTPLWLLTETGMIGLLLFVVFITMVLQALLREIKLSTNNVLAKSSIAILVSFSVASLATEILYQRYLWFFLGIILFQEYAKTILFFKSFHSLNFLKQNYLLQLDVEKKSAGSFQESLKV